MPVVNDSAMDFGLWATAMQIPVESPILNSSVKSAISCDHAYRL
jgi:hypothetical protein